MLGSLRQLSRAALLLAPLSMAALVGAVWHFDNWGLTPERAAKRDGFCEGAAKMKTQAQTPTTALVICQGLPNSFDGAYVYVSRLPWGLWWAAPNGGSFSYRAPEATSTELVDYIHYGPTQSAYTTLILHGRSRSPEVSVVEALLSDGRTLRDEVTNGLFVLQGPIQAVGVEVNELKVIGQNNQMLQQIQVNPAY